LLCGARAAEAKEGYDLTRRRTKEVQAELGNGAQMSDGQYALQQALGNETRAHAKYMRLLKRCADVLGGKPSRGETLETAGTTRDELSGGYPPALYGRALQQNLRRPHMANILRVRVNNADLRTLMFVRACLDAWCGRQTDRSTVAVHG
jgi:hypothetical protein